MKESFKKRFNFEEQIKRTHPLLQEDFEFKREEYDSLKDFEIIHQEVSFLESPEALERKIYLTHMENKRKTLFITIIHCQKGYKDALELLYKFPDSFTRPVPIDDVSEISRDEMIGDMGFGWSWKGEENPDMVAFIRNNVFISIEGNDVDEVIVSLTSEIDKALKKRIVKKKHIKKPPEEIPGLLSHMKEERSLSVPRGGRIDIGIFSQERQNLSFLTSSGSVNRDPDNPDLWYYRAGNEKGRQVITLSWVEKGIIPKKEQLIIEVV